MFRVVVLVVALVVVFLPGSAATMWWWPTQGEWIETGYISPDDGHETPQKNPSHWGVHFGSELALDRGTLVVGTQMNPNDDGARGGDAPWPGTDWAYVFERAPNGAWHQAAKLVPPEEQDGDSFAFSVDVDGPAGVVAVGNPAGERAYIFERAPDGSWIHTLDIMRPASPDGEEGIFGYTVAVSGDTVVVGWHPVLLIYEKTGTEWTKTGELPGGIHVDLQGDTLATSRWDSETGENAFAVYTRSDEGWVRAAELDPTEPYESENTVASRVEIREDETALILGGPMDRRLFGLDTETMAESIMPGASGFVQPVGSAWIYELEEDSWKLAAEIPNPNPSPSSDGFGDGVSIEGDRAVVGAPREPYSGATGAGAVYTYEKVGGVWVFSSKLRNHDNGPYGGGDFFGEAVSLSDGILAVGAPWDDQRRDGIPAPADDDGDVPACLHRDLVWGCDEGENAGSVYTFESARSFTGGLPE